MNWQVILKMPWVQTTDFSKHPSPKIGRYIKYLENLLNENHRFAFKRWWSMGAIKTAPREEGGKYKELPHEGEHSMGGRKGKVDAWKKKLEAGEVKEEYDPMKDPNYQAYKHYTRDLPSSGLEHMKAYYERNAEIDSDLDMAYEKEYEHDPDSALEKADNEFAELMEDLGELVEDIRTREVHRQRDSAITAMHHGEPVEQTIEGMKGKIVLANKKRIPPDTDTPEGKWTLTKSHHGWTMRIWPKWLPQRTRIEHTGRTVTVDSVRIRINKSQGPTEFAVCYMVKEKQVGEICMYKTSRRDVPFGDFLVFVLDGVLHSKEMLIKLVGRGFGGWGATRESGEFQQGHVKEWHHLPEDSSWYRKGILLITRVLEELKKIGRTWEEEMKELTHQTPGNTWKDTTPSTKPKLKDEYAVEPKSWDDVKEMARGG